MSWACFIVSVMEFAGFSRWVFAITKIRADAVIQKLWYLCRCTVYGLKDFALPNFKSLLGMIRPGQCFSIFFWALLHISATQNPRIYEIKSPPPDNKICDCHSCEHTQRIHHFRCHLCLYQNKFKYFWNRVQMQHLTKCFHFRY